VTNPERGFTDDEKVTFENLHRQTPPHPHVVAWDSKKHLFKRLS
jgi:hypothetical protein